MNRAAAPLKISLPSTLQGTKQYEQMTTGKHARSPQAVAPSPSSERPSKLGGAGICDGVPSLTLNFDETTQGVDKQNDQHHEKRVQSKLAHQNNMNTNTQFDVISNSPFLDVQPPSDDASNGTTSFDAQTLAMPQTLSVA